MTRLEVWADLRHKWCWLYRDDNEQLVMQGGGFPTHSLAISDANSALERLDEGDDS